MQPPPSASVDSESIYEGDDEDNDEEDDDRYDDNEVSKIFQADEVDSIGDSSSSVLRWGIISFLTMEY